MAAVALSLAACSTVNLEVGERLEPGRLERFEVGRTGRADVLASLGPPTALTAHAGGVALLYQFAGLRETQLGFSLDSIGTLLGVPALAIVKLSLGSSSAHHEAAVLLFDSDGVLSGMAQGDWDEIFGKGGSLQFLFAVEQVVDSGTMRADHGALVWGRELLDPLTWSLNQGHRADLELRGTGVKAGQKTLELRDPAVRE